MVNWKPFAFKMKCKCGKLFSHNYKAYCCSELKVRIPLILLQPFNETQFTGPIVTYWHMYYVFVKN